MALDIEQTYRTHGHVVLRRARQILGNEADAREVLHDVFLSLLREPAQYRGRSSITTFLYAMTTNRCLNQIRNQRRRTALVEQKLASAAMSRSASICVRSARDSAATGAAPRSTTRRSPPPSTKPASSSARGARST